MGQLIADIGSAHIAISIHPPREGWDEQAGIFGIIFDISIHPPREGWDDRPARVVQAVPVFQSTHPVRGGTVFYIQAAFAL